MDTIYVPVCFKCRVSEHEIATGRGTGYANCAQHMCRVLSKFPNNFAVLTNFPSLNDLCVCVRVCGVCVGLIAGRMFLLPAGQIVDM